MSGKMHLVFVSSLLPVENPASGFDIANRVILDAIRAQGIEVSLLGYNSPGVELAAADRSVVLGEPQIVTAKATFVDKVKWLTRALIQRTTISSAKMLECEEAKLQSALQSLQPFDGLVLNSVQLPGAFLSVFMKHDSIFIAHNVEAVTATESARYSPRLFERVLFRREAEFVESIEQRLCLEARFVWTLSEEDRHTLRIDDDNKSASLPMVSRTKLPAGHNGARDLKYDLGMIGTWSWRPNRIGLDWFLKEIVPHLPADMTIAIAGNLPDPPGVLPHPGIRFVGRVPEARTFLKSCAVVPLVSTAGTGIQLKTIETFEMGLPCVATPNALRGIKRVPANCTIEKDAQPFAAALVGAVRNARGNPAAILDGSGFHESQMQGLGDAIARGLARLGNG